MTSHYIRGRVWLPWPPQILVLVRLWPVCQSYHNHHTVVWAVLLCANMSMAGNGPNFFLHINTCLCTPKSQISHHWVIWSHICRVIMGGDWWWRGAFRALWPRILKMAYLCIESMYLNKTFFAGFAGPNTSLQARKNFDISIHGVIRA